MADLHPAMGDGDLRHILQVAQPPFHSSNQPDNIFGDGMDSSILLPAVFEARLVAIYLAHSFRWSILHHRSRILRHEGFSSSPLGMAPAHQPRRRLTLRSDSILDVKPRGNSDFFGLIPKKTTPDQQCWSGVAKSKERIISLISLPS